MPFDVDDDEIDLDDLFSDVELPDENMYIANEDKAVELISELIKNKRDSSISFRKRIEKKINDLFSEFSIKPHEYFVDIYINLRVLFSAGSFFASLSSRPPKGRRSSSAPMGSFSSTSRMSFCGMERRRD